MKLIRNVLGGVLGKVGGLVGGLVIPPWLKWAAAVLALLLILAIFL